GRSRVYPMQENLRARVAAAAAIFRGDQILLLHRSSHASNPGAWDLPGGHVEPGETLTRAARREVREETGFDVRIGPLFHAEVFGSISKRGKIRPTVGVYFHCVGPSRKSPRLDRGEHTEYAWVRASELEDYPTVPYLARTVRAAFESRDRVSHPRELSSAPGSPASLLHLTLPVPA
ncbi:MAG: NUDIX domain-containing protein, partial [Thermoplasmata archaeon]